MEYNSFKNNNPLSSPDRKHKNPATLLREATFKGFYSVIGGNVRITGTWVPRQLNISLDQ